MKDQIRAEFEQEFPLPNGVTFDGDHYVADPNVLGAFQNATIWSHMFRGWKACAQPARQAGGDEREAIKEFKALGFDFGPATPDEMNKPQEIEKLVSQINAMHQQENTAAQRAALTPAAVVMPKRPGDFYLHEPGYQRGWVAHQIEVARLNRNAIPVELLERAADQLEYHMCSGCKEETCCMPDTRDVLNELRALIGKEGE